MEHSVQSMPHHSNINTNTNYMSPNGIQMEKYVDVLPQLSNNNNYQLSMNTVASIKNYAETLSQNNVNSSNYHLSQMGLPLKNAVECLSQHMHHLYLLYLL
jgi:hypothetical protein